MLRGECLRNRKGRVTNCCSRQPCCCCRLPLFGATVPHPGSCAGRPRAAVAAPDAFRLSRGGMRGWACRGAPQIGLQLSPRALRSVRQRRHDTIGAPAPAPPPSVQRRRRRSRPVVVGVVDRDQELRFGASSVWVRYRAAAVARALTVR